MRIAHIINPVKVPSGRDLFSAQPVTFETMRIAKAAASNLDIHQYAAFFPEDEGIIPAFLTKTPPLDRSILETCRFPKKKKLPYIKDILDRLYYLSSADYFIYTNVDIALTPEFYLHTAELIQQGYDGFAINRRTISKRYSRVEDIPKMLESIKKGRMHPGYDCFVFKRETYPRFHLGQGCVGANWIGRILLCNIMAFSSCFHIFKDKYWTFHIGDDRTWMKNGYNSYNAHNEQELVHILEKLRDRTDNACRNELKEMYYYHMKRILWRGIPKNIQVLNAPEKKGETNVYPKPHQSVPALRKDPVFIVGFPRAGTTLVQALLASQPEILTLPETHFFSMACRFVQEKKGKVLPGCLPDVIKMIRTRISFSRNAERHVRRLALAGTLTLRLLFETMLIDNFLGNKNDCALNSCIWMEKTPHHVFHLDRIFTLYPSARVVYVLRNPEKAILSRRRNFLFNDEYLWPVGRHARQWINGIINLEKWKAEKPKSVYVIRMESLVIDPEHEIRKLSEFLHIPLQKDPLQYFQEESQSLFYSWELWKAGVRHRLSPAMILRENDKLSEPDRYTLWKIAGNHMTKYGYKIIPPQNISFYFLLQSRIRGIRLGINVSLRRFFRVLPPVLPNRIRKYYHFIKRGFSG